MKPMLAGKAEQVEHLRFPVMASEKLDGVRALVIGGQLLSRSLKPIPNRWVQQQFSNLPEGTDGELIYGDPTHPDAYRNTVSAVMRQDGTPTKVNFHIFDNFNVVGGFSTRFATLRPAPNVIVVEHPTMKTAEDLIAFEAKAVAAGHEGIMVRSINGPYKFGRSTSSEGYLLKVKRFEDAEAVVLDTYEWEHNSNIATTNELGRTERSSHKAGMVGKGVLGGLSVRALSGKFQGVEFSIGTGFTGADDPRGERGKLWAQRTALVGKIAKFSYFPSGSKDKPRFPVFLGWRDPIDM